MGLAMPGYGLRTLETCRLEGGFVVAGWDFATELDPQPGFERTPFEVGLGWIVNLDAANFVGRDALIAQRLSGPRFFSRRFQLMRHMEIEDGESIYSDINGEIVEIGFVACSSWSWGLKQVIGNASIRAFLLTLGTDLLSISNVVIGYLHRCWARLPNPNCRKPDPM